MAREKDPAKIVETIAQSIRVSQRGARRVRAHRFKELFGYQALSAQRRQRIERLMAEAGIVVRPSLEQAGRDDWLVMSMPAQTEVEGAPQLGSGKGFDTLIVPVQEHLQQSTRRSARTRG